MADLTLNPTASVQNQDDGVLNASLTAAATSCTISPVKKWVNGVYTTGGFDSSAGFVKIIDSVGRYEFASFGAKSVDSSNITTLSSMRRGLSPSASTVSAGTGLAFDANTRIYVCDYAYMWNFLCNLDGAQTVTGVKTFTNHVVISGNGSYLDAPSMTTGNAPATADARVWYDTTKGQWQFGEGGTIGVLGASTVANMSTTVAGKAEEGTVAEQAAHTATGGTGARLVPAVANLVTLGADGTWVSGAIPTLNTAKFIDGSIGGTGVASPVLGAILIGGGAGLAMTPIGPGSSGQVPVSNGTTLAMGNTKNYAKIVYLSGVASGTITNPQSVETTFDTHNFAIPGNDLINGVAYEFEAIFTLVHGADGVIGIDICFGTTSLIGGIVNVGTCTNVSDGFFKGIIYGTAAANNTAAVKCEAYGGLNRSTAGTVNVYASTNVDTTGTLTLQWRGNYQSNSASNTMILTSAKIRKISSTAF